MKEKESEDKIEKLITKLLRNSIGDINTYFHAIDINKKINETESISHCYLINLDANGRPRIKDLAEFVALHLIDYSIPRKEIDDAQKFDSENKTTTSVSNLAKKARNLFTSLTKSGEGGEILLYMLVQEFLKFPQLICKMPLKTNTQVHYHGIDGIHVSVETDDDDSDILCLHWGESKLYKNIGSAIRESLTSIKGFLLSEGGSNGRSERDIQIIQAEISKLNDQRLENVLVQYFDKHNPKWNNLRIKGVCLIGFDTDKYPLLDNTEKIKQVKERIEVEIDEWINKIRTEIKKPQSIEKFEINIFLLPFPSVGDFRKAFIAEIK